jgi:hypothetical protein
MSEFIGVCATKRNAWAKAHDEAPNAAMFLLDSFNTDPKFNKIVTFQSISGVLLAQEVVDEEEAPSEPQ